CDTDMNVVMNDGGGFIEIQGTRERLIPPAARLAAPAGRAARRKPHPASLRQSSGFVVCSFDRGSTDSRGDRLRMARVLRRASSAQSPRTRVCGSNSDWNRGPFQPRTCTRIVVPGTAPMPAYGIDTRDCFSPA